MDPPERVQRWLRLAAGRRLHLGLMGTLSFRPAAPWCKLWVLNWLALPSSFTPPFFISLSYFTVLSDSTWDYLPLIISLCLTFHLPHLVLFISIIISLHLSILYSHSSLSLSSSLPKFNWAFFFVFTRIPNNEVCFMLLNSQHPNPADPWRPSVVAGAVVSQ